MKVIGLRCSPSEFSFVIIEGTQKSFTMVTSGRLKYPSGYSHCELLRWLYEEMGTLLTKHNVKAIGLKGTEAMRMKGKAYGDRMELEAMIFLQASQNGIKYAKRKVNSTIAKDLGLKGKGKYLETGFDYSSVTDYRDMSQHLEEATQVALSMLK